MRSGLADASLVLGVIGLAWAACVVVLGAIMGLWGTREPDIANGVAFGLILLVPAEGLGVLAAVFGAVGLLRIRTRPSEYAGKQAALRGLVCGILTWLAGPALTLSALIPNTIRQKVDDARERKSEKEALEGPCEGLVQALSQAQGDSLAAREWLEHRKGRLPPPSCLCHAIERERRVVAQWMIEHGTDLDARSCVGGRWAPLETALNSGQRDIVEQLLDHGADPNQSARDMPLLVLAAGNGDLPFVRLLLGKGARTDVRSRESATWDSTPLHMALGYSGYREGQPIRDPQTLEKNRSDRLVIIDELLDHGADPTAQDARSRTTPLHVAAAVGFVEGAQRLLERCAERQCTPRPLDVKDGVGRTPLDRAREGRRQERLAPDIARADQMIALLEAWSARSD